MNNDEEIIVYSTRDMLRGSLALLALSAFLFILANHMWHEAHRWQVAILAGPAAFIGILGLLSLSRAHHFVNAGLLFTFGCIGRWMVLGLLGLAFLAMLVSCAPPGPPQTSKDDPLWQLNEGKWSFSQNALIQPPSQGTP
jgi:hypothetical protein